MRGRLRPASSLPYCSICHRHVRNQGEHNLTLGHRNKLHPVDRRSRARRDRSAGKGRGRRLREGEDMESVRKYRRRRPLDGPRFSVHVRHYWRHIAQRYVPYPWETR